MTVTDAVLYEKDFATRPFAALGLGVGIVATLVVAAALTLPILALAAVPFVVAGVAGFLRSTTRLEIVAGRVSTRSRLGERVYEAADLTLERRGAANVYVLTAGTRDTVVCTFADAFAQDTCDACERAGVTIDASAIAAKLATDAHDDALARLGHDS